VAGVDAPQPRRAVDDLAALRRPVVHALGLGEQTRILLELPVRRERHEEGFEVVRHRCGDGGFVRLRHGPPRELQDFVDYRLLPIMTKAGTA